MSLDASPQLLADVARRRGAQGRVLGEAAGDEALQLDGDVGAQRRGQRRLVPRDGHEDEHRCLPVEGLAPRGHLEEQDTEGEEIAPLVDRAAGRLLGGHVVRRPEDAPLLRGKGLVPAACGLAAQLRDAEIEDLDAIFLAEDHVLGLEIAVDDARLVGLGEAPRERPPDAQHLRDRQAPRVPRQHVAQRGSLHELHGQKDAPVDLADLVDGRDVLVGRGGRTARLAEEPRAPLSRGHDLPLEHLERDAPAQRGVVRRVDSAHAPSSEQAGHVVATEGAANQARFLAGRCRRRHVAGAYGGLSPRSTPAPRCAAPRLTEASNVENLARRWT